MKRIIWLLALALVSAGCSKEKDVDPPAELVDFAAQLDPARVWSAKTGGGDEVLRLGLRPLVADDRVYVAGHGGDVQALEPGTGRSLWRVKTDLDLSGGPASGEGIVVAGTAAGDVIALDAATGAERWRVAVGGEVLAAPAIGGGLVVVRTVDGRLRGLRAADGVEAWSYEEPVPRLTLRGNGGPVIDGDMVLAGLDNGKVVALALASGDLLWTATIAPSRGRTEIERLADIDSPIRVIGEDVYVVGYQGRVAMLARESGQIWWGREMSSHRGLAADAENLYVTTADSAVVALRRRDGTELWRHDRLLRRSLTAPALQEQVLVVGDFEGYLHWLDAATGELLGRAKSGAGRISNAPVPAGDLLLLQTDSGEVQAYRARPRKAG
ncbi:MAG TPA: outer membrane protein assembly factor BamB [Steroidobacteraceae bacterium]|nr:outer membrane protein assembly factor BamB [Steroidobacteraceae bacterium]